MLNKEDEEEIKEDLIQAMELETLANSAGGKKLVKALREDILSTLDSLLRKRDTATLQEFISYSCDIKTKLDVIKTLSKAKSNKETLEAMLKEIE